MKNSQTSGIRLTLLTQEGERKEIFGALSVGNFLYSLGQDGRREKKNYPVDLKSKKSVSGKKKIISSQIQKNDPLAFSF